MDLLFYLRMSPVIIVHMTLKLRSNISAHWQRFCGLSVSAKLSSIKLARAIHKNQSAGT